MGQAAVTFNDINEIIAQHHARISAVQGRVLVASCLAQALTKRAWDSTREKGDFAVGEHVLLHRVAPNRMLPHYWNGVLYAHLLQMDAKCKPNARANEHESYAIAVHTRFKAARHLLRQERRVGRCIACR